MRDDTYRITATGARNGTASFIWLAADDIQDITVDWREREIGTSSE